MEGITAEEDPTGEKWARAVNEALYQKFWDEHTLVRHTMIFGKPYIWVTNKETKKLWLYPFRKGYLA